MFTASVLLAVIGVVGMFDIVVFHWRHARLLERPECRVEAWVHAARGVVYALQFAIVPNVRFTGSWIWALVALFVADVAIAALDVLVEPASRREQGGLPPGEYAMHVLLSVLVGAMIHSVGADLWAARLEPAALLARSDVPAALRLVLAGMAAGCFVLAIADALVLIEARLLKPAPIHVSVRIPTTVERLWTVTQDHLLHPEWDHRFDRIVMHGTRIETGTTMTYEKRVLGVTIRGWGRYKLHALEKQSTFEFGSDDSRSLIREGVGLWRYVPSARGVVELSTSYTYAVRWGLFGRVFDRLVFRPLFQWETERSFARLARRFFGVPRPRVLGREGRRRARFGAEATA